MSRNALTSCLMNGACDSEHTRCGTTNQSFATQDPIERWTTLCGCAATPWPIQQSPVRMELPPTCTNPALRGTQSSPPSARARSRN